MDDNQDHQLKSVRVVFTRICQWADRTALQIF